MTNYHDPRHSRRSTHSRKPRFKRPLVVLTYCEDRLTTIHSSTATVQFVRLDITPISTPGTDNPEPPMPTATRQLSVPLLTELPAELHQAAQRAFRRS